MCSTRECWVFLSFPPISLSLPPPFFHTLASPFSLTLSSPWGANMTLTMRDSFQTSSDVTFLYRDMTSQSWTVMKTSSEREWWRRFRILRFLFNYFLTVRVLLSPKNSVFCVWEHVFRLIRQLFYNNVIICLNKYMPCKYDFYVENNFLQI